MNSERKLVYIIRGKLGSCAIVYLHSEPVSCYRYNLYQSGGYKITQHVLVPFVPTCSFSSYVVEEHIAVYKMYYFVIPKNSSINQKMVEI